MNLTQKDKITLSILLVALTLFIGIWFIIKPAWSEVQDSKKTYNDRKSTYTTLQAQVEQRASIKQDVQKRHEECVEVAQMFYDDTDDFVLQQELYNQLTNVGITVTSNTLSQSTKILSPYRYRPNEIQIPSNDYASINPVDETTSDIVILPQTVGCYTFNVEFTGADKEKIFKFVENLTTYDHTTMVVTSLSFKVPEFDNAAAVTNPSGDAVDVPPLGVGSISLELYYMKTPEEPVFN